MGSPNIVDENGNVFEFPQKAYEKAVHEIIESNLKSDDYLIEVSAGSNKGDNYLGIVYRIDVKKADEIKLSFVLKSAPQNEARREEFHAHAAFARESLFYDEVYPLYKKFQEEKGIDVEKEGFDGVAHCYKILHDAPHEGLFFDNLRVKGFEMFNRHDDLEKENVLMTMKTLGKFHALFYSLKDQKPEEIKKFQTLDDLFLLFCGKHDSTVRIMMESQCEMAKALIKRSENEDLKKHVLKFLDRDLMKEMREITKSEKAEPYATICHGDCWNNNMMFINDSDGKPKEIKLLDFQIMRYASPVLDLVYYLFGCTTKKLRDKHYDEFINVYYQTLSDFMERLGSNAEKIFPRAALDDHFKKFGYFGMLMGVIIVPFFVSDPDDAPDFDLISESYKASQEDPTKEFDVSLVEFKSMSKKDKYEERMMGVFEDMYRLGYI